jgi:hypothetical protein
MNNPTQYDEIRNKISIMTDLMTRISEDWEKLSEEDKVKLQEAYTLEKSFDEIVNDLVLWEANLYDE